MEDRQKTGTNVQRVTFPEKIAPRVRIPITLSFTEGNRQAEPAPDKPCTQ